MSVKIQHELTPECIAKLQTAIETIEKSRLPQLLPKTTDYILLACLVMLLFHDWRRR